MFIIKKNYYLYIENTRDINLNLIKRNKKISIIYRNNLSKESLSRIKEFRRLCFKKKIKFFIANDIKLVKASNADGIYISSYNKNIYLYNNLYKIGSAHNFKEIFMKINQGCQTVILSRLFKTIYKNKRGFLGVVKFNLMMSNIKKELIPLGGIRLDNLNKVNMVKSSGIALLSEIKKKPAISNRLF